MKDKSRLNILLVGDAGRETALAWKISKSPRLNRLYIARGNPQTALYGTNLDIASTDIDRLLEFASSNDIDFTVVGPEAPLMAGIVDKFDNANLKVVGPSKEAAMLEGSKSFMKTILDEAGVPTARYKVARSYDEAISMLDQFDDNIVIKADGLCAGKGVVIPDGKDEAILAIKSMMIDKVFGKAGDTLVIEEKLEGEEASIIAITDGDGILLFPPSQDHKRAYDNDKGLNTGGMGAYAPALVVTEEMLAELKTDILKKTIDLLKERGIVYKGVLYAGIMVTEDGPMVLEYNCRFGDPECQPLMMKLKSDIVPIFIAALEGGISNLSCSWDERVALSVVLASEGYPVTPKLGLPITGLGNLKEAVDDVGIFFAGVSSDANGDCISSGGRVLSVTGLGDDISLARKKVYARMKDIKLEGGFFRKDIGYRAIDRI